MSEDRRCGTWTDDPTTWPDWWADTVARGLARRNAHEADMAQLRLDWEALRDSVAAMPGWARRRYRRGARAIRREHTRRGATPTPPARGPKGEKRP